MLLIVTPNFKGEVPMLAKTAEILGWDVYHGGWRIPEHLLHTPGAVYGEQFFCEVVAEQMGWTLLNNSLDWLTKLPEEYVNRKITFTTLAEARKITEEKFIKPADDKAFTAKVYPTGADLPTNEVLDNVPTLVSDVIKITSEYRCFIKNRKVVTASCYLYKHAHKEPEINNPENYQQNSDLVLEYITNLLADERVPCADGAVIDIARFKKDQDPLKFTVLESNPVWASGTYGCELVAVLDAIKAGCVSSK